MIKYLYCVNGKVSEVFETKEEAIAKLVARHDLLSRIETSPIETGTIVTNVESLDSLELDEHDVNSWVGFDATFKHPHHSGLVDLLSSYTIEMRGRGQILEDDLRIWKAGEYFATLGIDYRIEIDWKDDNGKCTTFSYDEETSLDSAGAPSSGLSIIDAKNNALL
jgi:hypothetical protein